MFLLNFTKIEKLFWQFFDKKNKITELCKGVHCVDLDESFQTHIFLQHLAWIQPRTRPVKFARSSGAASRSPAVSIFLTRSAAAAQSFRGAQSFRPGLPSFGARSWVVNDPERGFASSNHTANLSGLVLGFIDNSKPNFAR